MTSSLSKNSYSVSVGNVTIGGGDFVFIAGPCAVEGEVEITSAAQAVKAAGADMLRGGAFKPRTSPYSFQGLMGGGLEMLKTAGKETSLPTVSEMTGVDQADLFSDIDVIQIGARNMQNYELLKVVGAMGKPVILKRSFSSTVEEWLLSAEYLLSSGNDKVILCERGIRAYGSVGKEIIDFSAITFAKRASGLPVLVDPSHASASAFGVAELVYAAAAVGADGALIEVHPNPRCALCDGAHQITPSALAEIVKKARRIRLAL